MEQKICLFFRANQTSFSPTNEEYESAIISRLSRKKKMKKNISGIFGEERRSSKTSVGVF